jgi:hypothetical protein
MESLARIERLRRRMHELAKWRLQLLAQERERLTTAHEEMIQALGEGLLAFGPAAAAGSRRVRGIEQELARAEVVEKTLEQRSLDAGRLAKLADLRLEAARGVWEDALERRGLEELIEASIANPQASRKP